MPRMYVTTHAADRFRERHARGVPDSEARSILLRLASDARLLPDLTRDGQQQWITAPDAPYKLVMVCVEDHHSKIPLVCVTVLPKQPEYLNEQQRLADELLRQCEIDMAVDLRPPSSTPPPDPEAEASAASKLKEAERRLNRVSKMLRTAQIAETDLRQKLAATLAQHAKETADGQALRNKLADLLVGALPVLRGPSPAGEAYADHIIDSMPNRLLVEAERRVWSTL